MNKKIMVGVALAVIGAVAIGGYFFPKASNTVIKEVVKEVKSKLGGVTDYDEIGSNKVVFGYQRLAIASGTSTNSWANNTGEIVFVDYGEIYVPAKASSTMHLFMNISTSTADVDTDVGEYTFSTRSQLIQDMRVATSSYGLTSSYQQSNRPLLNNGSVYSTPTSTMAVYPNQFVVMSIVSDANTCSGPNATSVTSPTGSNCEQASSTNRGFNPFGFIRYHYYATTSPRI